MSRPIPWPEFLRGDAEVRMMTTRLTVRATAAGLADWEVAGILGLAASRWTFIREGAAMPLCREEERGVRLLGDLLGFAGLLLGGDEEVSDWLRSPCGAIGERPLERLVRDAGALGWMRNALERECLERGGL